MAHPEEEVLPDAFDDYVPPAGRMLRWRPANHYGTQLHQRQYGRWAGRTQPGGVLTLRRTRAGNAQLLSYRCPDSFLAIVCDVI